MLALAIAGCVAVAESGPRALAGLMVCDQMPAIAFRARCARILRAWVA